jgi:hypothetical protein
MRGTPIQKKGNNLAQRTRFQYCYVAGNRFGLTQLHPKTENFLEAIGEKATIGGVASRSR